MSSSRLASDQLAIGLPSFPSRAGSSVQIDCHLEGSSPERRRALCETRKWSTVLGRCRVTIDMLPDVALLEIFEFYMDQVRKYDDISARTAEAWYVLVHVCQKWRKVVFGSPRRLDLRLFCTGRTPVKETLDAWPPLPIVIQQYSPQTLDNVIVALEHSKRVCRINLTVRISQWEGVLAAMQKPFPALTDLAIWPLYLDDEPPAFVPESFLGGSAPRLRYLQLGRVSFPGLIKLLMSTTGLLYLYISKIPHSGSFSPEALVRCLSTLTKLESLSLRFDYPPSHPIQGSRRPLMHPSRRSILLSLTYFQFEGVSEYLEYLVARIDAPLLDSLDIRFFHQLIFDTPRLAKFVARTPNIRRPVEARITFSDFYVEVTFPPTIPKTIILRIGCRQSDWQLSSLTQVCSSSFPEAFISTVEHLYICEPKYGPARWQDDIEDGQWLETLLPFTAVKHLYLSREFMSRIGPALQELAEEVLPSVQYLFLEDFDPSDASEPVQGGIGKFVAVRQLAGQSVAVSRWDRGRVE